MKYGLVGQDVTSSFSKELHKLFRNNNYKLLSLNEEELVELLKSRKFVGINVTKPYKEFVIPYLDRLDSVASATQSVNTIINKRGLLIGYNTDYAGLKYLLKRNKITIENKTVAVLGTGGVAKTAIYLLKELKAKKIILVSRTKKENTITYEEVNDKVINVIINCSPYGMTPNNNDAPIINLDTIYDLECVVDLIYNPLSTLLLVKAKEKGIKAVPGLRMLIKQGADAAELFMDGGHPCVEDSHYLMMKRKLNVVLIGMPYAGKTMFGQLVSKKLKKEFIDVDVEIEKRTKMKIGKIFKEYGEEYFRKIEHEVIKELSARQNVVIATGGGAILDKSNIDYLKENGVVIWIKRDADLIEFKRNRPLCSCKTKYKELLAKREMYYAQYSNYVVTSGNINRTLEDILEGYYEAIDC